MAIARPGSIWVDGEYLKFVDTNDHKYGHKGNIQTSSPTNARHGSLWVDGIYICYIDQDGDAREINTTFESSPSNARHGSIWLEDDLLHIISQNGDKRYAPSPTSFGDVQDKTAPKNFSAAHAYDSDTTSLTWDEPDNGEPTGGYKIEKSVDNGSWATVDSSVSPTANSYTADDGCMNHPDSTTIEYRIQAYSSEGTYSDYAHSSTVISCDDGSCLIEGTRITIVDN